MSPPPEPEFVDAALGGRISREEFFKRGIAAGLSLPALAALLEAGQAAAGTRRRGVSALNFTAWDFQPDTIKQFARLFTKEYGVPVNLSVIPNVGYGPAIQTRLQGGQEIDVFYNFAYNSSKFVDQGWAATLNNMPGIKSMLAEMFPSSRERYVQSDGKVISAPYFSAIHMLMYNKAHLRKAGFGGPPKTFKEVYDQSKKLKDAGISQAPYEAYWIKEFCEEYFILYLLAEGITPFDKVGNPVFAHNPKTVGVLDWWQSMYQDGLTPKTILTDDPTKESINMGAGKSSFFVLHHYFLKIIRDTKGPQAHNVVLSWRMPGAAGNTLQIGEVLQLGAKAQGDTLTDAWNFIKFYGWKDKHGKYTVFRAWAKAAALGAPYPGFWKDPTVRAVFPKYYNLDKLAAVFKDHSAVVPTRTAPWYSAFQAKVGDRIQNMLLGQAKPADTVKALANDAASLKKSS